MRVIFMGTPDFSVGTLQAIYEAGHEVCLVVTQPDKPKGRGHAMQYTPVKEYAVEKGIEVFQPVKIREPEAVEKLRSCQADIMVVVAFGQIVSKEILEMCPYGCINVHASLLPKYRGAAPIQWSVINGDKETGVTTMQMNEGLDTGDMLLIEKMPIAIDDTAESVFDKLSVMGGEIIVKTLELLEKGEITPVKQVESLSSYAPMLDKSISEIDFAKDALTVHNLIRGLYSWPIAQTTFKGKKLKIYKSALSELSLDFSSVFCFR